MVDIAQQPRLDTAPAAPAALQQSERAVDAACPKRIGASANVASPQPQGASAELAPRDDPPIAANDPSPAKRKRAKRDPEGRRRAIVEAAAHLIGREGTRRLTHRRVAEQADVPLGSTTQYFASIDELRRAGLAELRRLIEQDYDEMFRDIARLGGTADAFARVLNDYLADTAQVDADTVFFAAAVHDPEVRPLAREAFEQSVRRALPYLDEVRATAFTVLIDGAMVDTCLRGEPIDADVVRFAVNAIFEAEAPAT